MLDSASHEITQELGVYLDRITEMNEFYTLLVDMFEKFITEWKGKFEIALH
jgi:hypothetical protein